MGHYVSITYCSNYISEFLPSVLMLCFCFCLLTCPNTFVRCLPTTVWLLMSLLCFKNCCSYFQAWIHGDHTLRLIMVSEWSDVVHKHLKPVKLPPSGNTLRVCVRAHALGSTYKVPVIFKCVLASLTSRRWCRSSAHTHRLTVNQWCVGKLGPLPTFLYSHMESLIRPTMMILFLRFSC